MTGGYINHHDGAFQAIPPSHRSRHGPILFHACPSASTHVSLFLSHNYHANKGNNKRHKENFFILPSPHESDSPFQCRTDPERIPGGLSNWTGIGRARAKHAKQHQRAYSRRVYPSYPERMSELLCPNDNGIGYVCAR